MTRPPDVIWLQYYGDDEPKDEPVEVRHGDVCWCSDKIFDRDVRYIRDKRYGKRKTTTKKPGGGQ